MNDKKILFLDDERQYVDGIDSFLKNFGYEVLATSVPADALKIIAESKPAVVFFDFKMPDMEGDQFFKKAKAIHSDAQYYLVSAYRNDATIEYFKGLGVNDVIMKPIDLNEILKIIK